MSQYQLRDSFAEARQPVIDSTTAHHAALIDLVSFFGCTGLVPEQLVQELAAKKVDYNFGELTPDTRKMTAIFANAYVGCQVINRYINDHSCRLRHQGLLAVAPDLMMKM